MARSAIWPHRMIAVSAVRSRNCTVAPQTHPAKQVKDEFVATKEERPSGFKIGANGTQAAKAGSALFPLSLLEQTAVINRSDLAPSGTSVRSSETGWRDLATGHQGYNPLEYLHVRPGWDARPSSI